MYEKTRANVRAKRPSKQSKRDLVHKWKTSTMLSSQPLLAYSSHHPLLPPHLTLCRAYLRYALVSKET
jgi:hypothetical protein